MTKKEITPHEWLFSERQVLVTIMARDVPESGKKLINFARLHLHIPIHETYMHWDYTNDVG